MLIRASTTRVMRGTQERRCPRIGIYQRRIRRPLAADAARRSAFWRPARARGLLGNAQSSGLRASTRAHEARRALRAHLPGEARGSVRVTVDDGGLGLLCSGGLVLGEHPVVAPTASKHLGGRSANDFEAFVNQGQRCPRGARPATVKTDAWLKAAPREALARRLTDP